MSNLIFDFFDLVSTCHNLSIFLTSCSSSQRNPEIEDVSISTSRAYFENTLQGMKAFVHGLGNAQPISIFHLALIDSLFRAFVEYNLSSNHDRLLSDNY
ncbi:hypothetical protein BpHYR1_039870 [Brachionus plicatilis]|uniref:Uncharacterized protein n=1 Tax=Brachionus plicatilis TaxID=10195 RepID=A0A3M7PEW1_BRAPC|nr:hypothetical protein BpHYR1_039870 [Brachionus plicatilis]